MKRQSNICQPHFSSVNLGAADIRLIIQPRKLIPKLFTRENLFKNEKTRQNKVRLIFPVSIWVLLISGYQASQFVTSSPQSLVSPKNVFFCKFVYIRFKMVQIFDIQLTRIQFVPQKYAMCWKTLPEAQRTQKLTPWLGLNLATPWHLLHLLQICPPYVTTCNS